jgi:hypothetical protein
MMERTLIKKMSIALSALFLVAILGIGCASQDDLKAQQAAAEAAMKKAEAAAVRAEAAAKKAEDAATRADACSTKCEKAFEKGLKK